MYSLAQIQEMNREKGRESRKRRLQPYIAECDHDERVFSCPHFGDYRPKGWDMVEQYFVDSSGFGQAGEPALTAKQFLGKVKQGQGYAIIEAGQFQVYIGEFVKLVK